jgi:hypothetical protein
MTLSCDEYDLGLLGLLVATSNGVVMKMIETKGNFVFRLVKTLLGLCRFKLDRVRRFMGRLARLGSKPKALGPRLSARSPYSSSNWFTSRRVTVLRFFLDLLSRQ